VLQAPNVSVILILAIFFATLWLLNKFLFRPVSAILDEREVESATAAGSLEAAEASFKAAAQKVENDLAAARREALKIREETRADGHRMRDAQVGAAKEEAARRIDTATAEIDGGARRAREELPGKVASIVALLVEKILGRKAA